MTSGGSSSGRRVVGPFSLVAAGLLAALGLARASEGAHLEAGLQAEHGRSRPATNLDRLAVLDWSLWSVAKYYVDPERVDPQRITLSALEALEAELPEVLVSASEVGTVRVQVGTASAEFSTELSGLWEVAIRLREIFAFVIENTQLDDKQRQAAEFALVDGVLRTLDPHTRLLRPEALDEMNQSTKGSFGGLGIEVGLRDDLVTILRVLDGTPAQAAGLAAGDRIVQVDKDSTVALALADAVALLKGPPDTSLTVYVRREGHHEPLAFEVTRAIIKLDSVSADLLPLPGEDGQVEWVGLVQINRTFARTTGEELREELDRLQKHGVKGLVLDMRQNPGGLLDAAVEVADAFLTGGTIVSTVGSADLRKLEEAKAGGDFPNLPIVVLIDEGSASATEIVAGALRNHDRALIMGRRSFGKGSVQVLYDRRMGERQLGLKLTRAQYLTPGEVSIQSVGVSPDLETVPVTIAKSYAAYFGRRRFDLVREETLSQHLDHDTAITQQITAGPLYYLQRASLGVDPPAPPAAGEQADLEEGKRRRAELLLADPEIRIARDLVGWAPSPDRQMLLEGLPEFARLHAQREQARISSSLALRGVDWSAPSEASAASLRVEIDSDHPGHMVQAGEKLHLRVKVTNTGAQPAYRVHAMSSSDYGYYDERELFFGKIEAGATIEQSITLAAASHELTRRDRVQLEFDGAGPLTLSADSSTALDLGVQGRTRANFAFSWEVIDDPSQAPDAELRGDGDGRLEPGERAQLRIHVHNRGEGASLATTVRVRSSPRSPLFFDQGRARLGELASGGEHEALFVVEFRGEASGETEILSVSVADSKVGEYLTQNIELPSSNSADLPSAQARSVAPPRVQVTALPVSTDLAQIEVSGRALVDGPLRDLYVTVYNPARHPFEGAQKHYYLANPDPQSGSLSFSAQVPLEPGNNLVEVFARGEGEALGWSRHWVLRSSGLDAGAPGGDPRRPN